MRRLAITCLEIVLLLIGCQQTARVDSSADNKCVTRHAQHEPLDYGSQMGTIGRGIIDTAWYVITLGYDAQASRRDSIGDVYVFWEDQAAMRARNHEYWRGAHMPSMGGSFGFSPDLSGISVPAGMGSN